MVNQLKTKDSMFDGFSDNQLLILLRNIGPSTKERENQLMQELFRRYFNEGRRFNLYSHLKGKHSYFAYTIHIELAKESIEIPDRDLEDFSDNLLKFIEFIDSQIKMNPDLTMEWSLHELEGIKNMIDRIRKIQMLDANLKQKMNLFVDNINELRKEALLKLEENKNTNMELVVVDDKSVAILKEEIKRLSIPLSKVRKDDFLEIARELNMYYEEDKKKIIKHGLKKFEYDFLKDHTFEAFKLIESGEIIPKYNVYSVFSSALSKYSRRGWKNDEYSKEEYLHKIKEFLFKHFDENQSAQVLKKICSQAKMYYTNDFLEYYDSKIRYSLSHEHKHLSQILDEEVVKDKGYKIDIVYVKEKQKYVVGFEHSGPSYDDYYAKLGFIEVHELLKEIKESTFIEGSVSKKELMEMYQEIQDKFYGLQINECIIQKSKDLNYNISEIVEVFAINKIAKKLLNEDEKLFLFTTLEGFKWFVRYVVDSFRNSLNFGRAYTHYMYDYEEFVFGNLKLSNAEHRKIFLNWNAMNSDDSYYKKYYEKIRDEIPHEYQVISSYYDSETEEEYEVFVYDDEYDDNNPFVKMMFIIENRKIGERKLVKGVKIGNDIMSITDAKMKAVVDYFMKIEKIV